MNLRVLKALLLLLTCIGLLVSALAQNWDLACIFSALNLLLLLKASDSDGKNIYGNQSTLTSKK